MICPNCGNILKEKYNGHCKCGLKYNSKERYLSYDFDSILFREFGKKYLRNKILNNNGYLSYIFLEEASLSINTRVDVSRFKDFIELHLRMGSRILDMGCGILEEPGYLNFDLDRKYQYFGLDPIDNDEFRGYRVVGCSEYTPFEEGYFDAIIFATSLDHVVSIDKTLKEAFRILNEKGSVYVWMSDRSRSIAHIIKTSIYKIYRNLKLGYNIDEFYIYPNYTVFHVPNWAKDPFHSIDENPQKFIRYFKKNRFYLLDSEYNNKNEIFLHFSKKSPKR